MKKKVILVTIPVILVVASYMVFAQEDMHGMMQQSGSMCPMHGMMCKSMMEKHMVAAEDGGVYVLAGSKLMKYDEDLELEKQVELAVDMEKMQQKMQSMMQNCPMRKQMMQNQGGMMQQNAPN